MDGKIRQLFIEDQANRKNGDWQSKVFLARLRKKDRQRRKEAERLLLNPSGLDGDDYFHLSLIFQHGETPEDYLRANELAKKAMELGHPYASRMVANSYDRWLTATTNPPRQKYGTQFRWDEKAKKYEMYPVDPETTDEERAQYQVPSLAELEKEMR